MCICRRELSHEYLLAKFGFDIDTAENEPCIVCPLPASLAIPQVHLGGSLGLYDAYEMHMVLWYMDFLYGVRLYELGELQVWAEIGKFKFCKI